MFKSDYKRHKTEYDEIIKKNKIIIYDIYGNKIFNKIGNELTNELTDAMKVLLFPNYEINFNDFLSTIKNILNIENYTKKLNFLEYILNFNYKFKYNNIIYNGNYNDKKLIQDLFNINIDIDMNISDINKKYLKYKKKYILLKKYLCN
jgi:cobalamin biosynthesis Mg chelatase CobN